MLASSFIKMKQSLNGYSSASTECPTTLVISFKILEFAFCFIYLSGFFLLFIYFFVRETRDD